jgi:hypothetical protein
MFLCLPAGVVIIRKTPASSGIMPCSGIMPFLRVLDSNKRNRVRGHLQAEYHIPMAFSNPVPMRCDSTLGLAEKLGIGTRDLKRIEVIGTPIAQARFDFRAVPGGVQRSRPTPG